MSDSKDVQLSQPKKDLNPEQMLQVIFSYAQKIANERKLENLLVLMADMGRELVVADRCALWLLDPIRNELWTKVAHGVEAIRMPSNKGIAGLAVSEKKPIIINDAYKDPRSYSQQTDKETGYKTKAIIAIPLQNNDGEVMGAYQAVNKLTAEERFSEDDLAHLTLAASYSAKSLESAMLSQEIEDTQKEIIVTMGSIAENRSLETANHVKRVAEYSKLLALKFGLSEHEAELLKSASPMHDIGKVGIPDSVLKKQGKLSDDEFNLMKTHAKIGYDLLNHSNRRILKAASIVAHEHHEKYNGTGYPHGKSREEIHIYGRITAVADVFDALGSKRCYKEAWELDRIVNFFKDNRGEHFDPNLVNIFIKNLAGLLEIRKIHEDK